MTLKRLGAVFFWLASAAMASGASLWEVEGFPSTLYLAGSVHVMARDEPLPPIYLQSLEKCKQVFFEVHPEELAAPGQVRKMREGGRLPEGTTLEEVLPPELMEKLRQRAGGRLSSLRHLQPWMVALRLVNAELEALGLDRHWGVEQRLYRRAREQGLSVRGLETVQDQARMFRSLNNRQQQFFLEGTLDALDHTGESLDEMMRAWRNADLEAIAGFFVGGAFGEAPDLAEIFLTGRNRKWLPAIERIGHGGMPTMIVVGVGHLSGPGSLIDLLEKRGYACKRISK